MRERVGISNVRGVCLPLRRTRFAISRGRDTLEMFVCIYAVLVSALPCATHDALPARIAPFFFFFPPFSSMRTRRACLRDPAIKNDIREVKKLAKRLRSKCVPRIFFLTVVTLKVMIKRKRDFNGGQERYEKRHAEKNSNEEEFAEGRKQIVRECTVVGESIENFQNTEKNFARRFLRSLFSFLALKNFFFSKLRIVMLDHECVCLVYTILSFVPSFSPSPFLFRFALSNHSNLILNLRLI